MGIFGRDEDESAASQPQPARQPQGSAQPPSTVTVIARSNRVEGTVLGSGDIRVEGHIQGAVDSTGQLLVAENGRVEGKISSRGVTVSGRVQGDILAKERIELQASAVVEGNITAPRILINDGATFDGQVLMKDPAEHAPGGSKTPITTSSARRPEHTPNDDSADKDRAKNNEPGR
jgi:cytoskeletal protein CcmA (bactofilin family)